MVGFTRKSRLIGKEWLRVTYLTRKTALVNLMFDPTDSRTLKALLELREIHANDKPVILWIGGGASRWAGYPTWYELAEKLHSDFIKFEVNYDSKAGIKALKQQALQLVFCIVQENQFKPIFCNLIE